MNYKKLLIGFAFFFVSYVIARLLDAKLGVTEKVAGVIPGFQAKA